MFLIYVLIYFFKFKIQHIFINLLKQNLRFLKNSLQSSFLEKYFFLKKKIYKIYLIYISE